MIRASACCLFGPSPTCLLRDRVLLSGVRVGLPLSTDALVLTGELAFCFVSLSELRSIGENPSPQGTGRIYRAFVAWLSKTMEARQPRAPSGADPGS